MKPGKLSLRQPPLTREGLVNPHRAPFTDRLREAGAIDLTNNHQIVRLRGDYDRVVATDRTRLVK
jgi:hypothetical protein